MKKFMITMVAVIATVLSANAEGWWTGGNAGFWYNTDSEKAAFSLSPEFGYDINEKWTAAAVVGLNYNDARLDDKTVFTIEPYVKYKAVTAGNFILYFNGGIGVGVAGGDGFKAGINPGIIYVLDSHWSVASNFGFLGYRDGCFAGKGGEGFGFGLDNTLSFGLYYAF